MNTSLYDIIVIGAGSGGLSVGLFMNEAGFKVLMIDKTDHRIGGECLNDGCVPSKALIHVAKLAHAAKEAGKLGLNVNGKVDINKATEYVFSRQNTIRAHENAAYFRQQGIDILLGEASFYNNKTVTVEGQPYSGKKIVIATGSKPRKLAVPGVELVNYFDNESIFTINELPQRFLMVGGGPISIEMAQAFSRLGSEVTVVTNTNKILAHDDERVTQVLLQQLKKEGIHFIFGAEVSSFSTSTSATIKYKNGDEESISFDAVFVGIGRTMSLDALQLHKAGVEVKKNKIVVNGYLQTTNKNVYVCGDVAGSLQFSHAAEQQGRLLLNNFFSPLKKKLNNDHMSWVTFTDPEVATFGLNEHQLKERGINYHTLDKQFDEDDRAIVDDYTYARLVLFISKGYWWQKETLLGGTMVAPNAGELIQELVIANTNGLSINTIFNKIYAYPVASRINQLAIVQHKQQSLTGTIKRLLHFTYKLFS